MGEDDRERWVTYAEAGQLLGISAEAARQVARRRKWPRRTPNAYGQPARVLMPEDALVRPRTGGDQGKSPVQMSEPNGRDQPDGQALNRAIEALREQLAIANNRADALQARLDASERERREVQARLTGLLTHRQLGSVPAVPGRAPWWRRLLG